MPWFVRSRWLPLEISEFNIEGRERGTATARTVVETQMTEITNENSLSPLKLRQTWYSLKFITSPLKFSAHCTVSDIRMAGWNKHQIPSAWNPLQYTITAGNWPTRYRVALPNSLSLSVSVGNEPARNNYVQVD